MLKTEMVVDLYFAPGYIGVTAVCKVLVRSVKEVLRASKTPSYFPDSGDFQVILEGCTSIKFK